MRKILFRGKRVDNGEWVQGSLFSEGTRFEIVRGTCNTVGIEGVEVIPETIGQYTGLTDKNGKHIFEGDIIDTPDRLIKVVWLTGNAQFDLNFIRYAHDIIITNFKGIYMRDLKEYEVIGNMHDNPELLKE